MKLRLIRAWDEMTRTTRYMGMMVIAWLLWLLQMGLIVKIPVAGPAAFVSARVVIAVIGVYLMVVAMRWSLRHATRGVRRAAEYVVTLICFNVRPDPVPQIMNGYYYGWRRNDLAFVPRTSEVSFRSVSIFVHHYGKDATARCSTHQGDTCPATNCACGFYSFFDQADALSYSYATKYTCLARAANSGRILLHRLGSRSQRQVITDLWLPPYCRRCGIVGRRRVPAEVMVAKWGKIYSEQHYRRLWPACHKHRLSRSKKSAYFSAQRIAQILQVDVRWMEGHPLANHLFQPAFVPGDSRFN